MQLKFNAWSSTIIDISYFVHLQCDQTIPVLMTPNIHAHYTDHGQLQFCSVILEDNVEINFGATIMPLTQYLKGCRLRPHAVTVKGQICEEENEYFGNPCKADMSRKMLEYGALLFPGQGSVSTFG